MRPDQHVEKQQGRESGEDRDGGNGDFEFERRFFVRELPPELLAEPSPAFIVQSYYLAEQGYDYVCDWVLDDQPLWLKTQTRPLVSVPYTQECNDVAMMLIQHHKASEYFDRARDQFDQIYADSYHRSVPVGLADTHAEFTARYQQAAAR